MRLRKLIVAGLAPVMLDDEHRRQLGELAAEIVEVPGTADLRAELAGAAGPAGTDGPAGADGLIVGFAVPVDAGLIDAAPGLRYLGVASTAYDVVDVAHARDRGVTVTTLPGYTTEPVAQFTIAVLLERACGLVEGRRLRAAGNLLPLAFPARQFSTSNVGVVGLGAIGGRVAQLAAGLGARVGYWSRRRTAGPARRFAELDELLSWADVVSVNLPLTAETAGILDERRLESIKPGAVLVSCAPMALLDRAALARRLGRGDLTVVCNHATPGDLAEFAGHPGFVEPPVVYLTPQAHAAMQDLLVGNLRSARPVT